MIFLWISQVQDFYVSMKLNKGATSREALYQLFVACCMLHNIKTPGHRTAHNYPKIQLCYLLILAYWKKINFYAYRMMNQHMAIFNEELGEITFSILGRVVLGDHCKDNFVHMNKMYQLLPLYRNIKDDVLKDSNVKCSLSWRHHIRSSSEEVQNAILYFKACVRQISSS